MGKLGWIGGWVRGYGARLGWVLGWEGREVEVNELIDR